MGEEIEPKNNEVLQENFDIDLPSSSATIVGNPGLADGAAGNDDHVGVSSRAELEESGQVEVQGDTVCWTETETRLKAVLRTSGMQGCSELLKAHRAFESHEKHMERRVDELQTHKNEVEELKGDLVKLGEHIIASAELCGIDTTSDDWSEPPLAPTPLEKPEVLTAEDVEAAGNPWEDMTAERTYCEVPDALAEEANSWLPQAAWNGANDWNRDGGWNWKTMQNGTGKEAQWKDDSMWTDGGEWTERNARTHADRSCRWGSARSLGAGSRGSAGFQRNTGNRDARWQSERWQDDRRVEDNWQDSTSWASWQNKVPPDNDWSAANNSRAQTDRTQPVGNPWEEMAEDQNQVWDQNKLWDQNRVWDEGVSLESDRHNDSHGSNHNHSKWNISVEAEAGNPWEDMSEVCNASDSQTSSWPPPSMWTESQNQWPAQLPEDPWLKGREQAKEMFQNARPANEGGVKNSTNAWGNWQ